MGCFVCMKNFPKINVYFTIYTNTPYLNLILVQFNTKQHVYLNCKQISVLLIQSFRTISDFVIKTSLLNTINTILRWLLYLSKTICMWRASSGNSYCFQSMFSYHIFYNMFLCLNKFQVNVLIINISVKRIKAFVCCCFILPKTLYLRVNDCCLTDNYFLLKK